MSEEELSESGGTMRRLPDPVGPVTAPDLALLEPLRRGPADPPADATPYAAPGEVVAWHWGNGLDLLRVVREDARGLVAWLPSGSERIIAVPRDGQALRSRSVAERARLAAAEEFDLTVRPWHGPGILRAAPAGRPWSIWWFWGDDGTLEGHYVNLELPHRRAPGHTYSRDLTLDLWLGADGEVWLKDYDEVDAAVDAGLLTPAQAATIHAVADQARAELIEPRAWPLDEGWEGWRPPPAYDAPLLLPADLRPAEG